MDNSQIIMYQTEDGLTKIEVTLETKPFGLAKIKWLSFFKEINLQSPGISKTSLKKENRTKIQLLQKLQQLPQMKNIRCRVNSEETRCRTI